MAVKHHWHDTELSETSLTWFWTIWNITDMILNYLKHHWHDSELSETSLTWFWTIWNITDMILNYLKHHWHDSELSETSLTWFWTIWNITDMILNYLKYHWHDSELSPLSLPIKYIKYRFVSTLLSSLSQAKNLGKNWESGRTQAYYSYARDKLYKTPKIKMTYNSPHKTVIKLKQSFSLIKTKNHIMFSFHYNFIWRTVYTIYILGIWRICLLHTNSILGFFQIVKFFLTF